MKYYIFLLTSSFVFCQTQMKPEETEVWNPEPEKVIPGTLNSAQVMQLFFLMELIFLNGKAQFKINLLSGL